MAMISSPRSFDPPAPLISCGIDSERIERFVSWIPGTENPLPLVFTDRELAHCRAQRDPARALCASFCCKEAVFKALGEPYNFTDCELLPDLSSDTCPIALDKALCAAAGIDAAGAWIIWNTAAGRECAVVAYLFGNGTKSGAVLP